MLKQTEMKQTLQLVKNRFKRLKNGSWSSSSLHSLIIFLDFLVVSGPSTDTSKSSGSGTKTNQPTSIWDVSVDKTILVNVLVQPQLKALFKGFVIVYDIRKASTMNDNKITILEDSFKRSKFGALHWEKTETNNNVCPM